MTPVEYQEDLTGIRFLLEAEGAAAFDDITRDGQVRTLQRAERRTTGPIPSARRA